MNPVSRRDLLDSLLTGIPAFVFTFRREGLGLLSVTDGVKALTGFEARDLLANPGLFFSRLSTGEKGELERICANLAEDAMPMWEFPFRCADGKSRWFRARLTKRQGLPGDPDAVTGIALANEEERSARRKAIEAVSILETAGDVIIFADLEGGIRQWNRASELFFGWSRKEMVGSAMHRLFPVPPEVVDGMIRTVRAGKTVSQESRLHTKSRGEVDCRVTISRVSGEGGAPVGMVLTILGTAERKDLESQLQQLVTRLRTIERVNRVIASDWDIGKVHGRIAGELEKLIDFDRSSVAAFEEGKELLLIHVSSKGRTELGTGSRIPLERSAAGWVLSHRITRVDADMAASPDPFAEDGILRKEGMRSRLMIPLFAGERIVGTLGFNSRRKGAYSLLTVDGLGSIPDQMAMAIEKYRMVTGLRTSEEKYRFLFEHGPPAATVGRDGRFLDVNAGCLQLYGYEREEFLRLAVSELFGSPERDSQVDTVLSTGMPVEAEVLQKRRDGTHFWGLLNVFPVSGDLVLGQITDITQRKDAEEALRTEKDFSSRILAVANVLIVVMDREGRILLFNRKCEEVTGWRESEVRGKHLWDLLLPERAVAPIREAFSQLDEKDLFPFYENPWHTRDGRERNIRWNNSVTRNERGEVVWVIGTGLDVTEQRQLEEQLRHIQKMDAVGTLAGGIAHDFNNIIQAIMGYTSVLKARIGDSADGAEEIEAIERAGLRASELTTQLLGFARGGKYEVRPVDLNQVVEKVVSMIRHTFDRSIEIRTEMDDALSAVEGDAGQLEQTVLNLCINARDAMPKGGLLMLRTCHETVSGEEEGGPEGAPRGTYAALALSDTGVGIPPENIPRIFEPFFSTKETGKGSGMGLAMAYGIVKNHGGFLDVRSVPGKGTTFRVLLPISSKEVLPPPAPAPDEPAVGGMETILFIDDEESLRMLAVEMLGRLGYKVLTAGNGLEAVKTFEERRGEIAVVILDMIMPGMGGEETFHRLKEIDPTVRILISSGYAVEGRPQSLLSAGAAGFLQKPYRVGTLAATMRRIIGGGSP
ncbi:MAG: PAS domain S-box protein [Deltaproteobacteria bacterium]|nr:MAG: PAS domain S-box protein [Deltaproteobacteria bacterium]